MIVSELVKSVTSDYEQRRIVKCSSSLQSVRRSSMNESVANLSQLPYNQRCSMSGTLDGGSRAVGATETRSQDASPHLGLCMSRGLIDSRKLALLLTGLTSRADLQCL